MSLTGLAHSEFAVENRSVITGTGPKGITGVQGPTEMGAVNDPKIVGSWAEFLRVFGGLVTDDDFPLYCRRMLEAGATLRVNRLGHYTDIDDAATLVGVKATITLGSGGNTAVFTAKNIGAWANGCVVTAVVAASGIAGRLDIKFTFPNNSNMNQTIYNVKNTGLTATDKQKFNNESQYIDIGTTAGTLAAGTATLASGAQDRTAIVAVDYNGSDTSHTGWRAFDEHPDIIKLCAPSKADNDIDVGLAAYVAIRKDIIGVIRTPVGLDDSGAVDYREGTGAYAGGVVIDDWRMLLSTGGLKTKNPETLIPIEISEIGDVVACHARRDNDDKEMFFAAAGPQRGRIKNASGVVYNVGTPARTANGDNLVFHGINPVIKHDQYGVVYWGNRTMTKTYAGTLLEKTNVAELIVNIYRETKPLIDIELFRPNDPQSWKNVYRKVRDYMETVAEKRGIYGGEGSGWIFQGDQDIDDITQAQVNSANDIAAGRWYFNLYIKPVGAMEYIGMRVIVNNNDVNYELLTSQPGGDQ